MIPQLAWPISSDQVRLSADVFLIWSVISYARNDNTLQLKAGFPLRGDGDRISVDLCCSLLGGIITLAWAIGSGCQWALAGIVLVSSLLVPSLRRLLLRRQLTEFLPFLELISPLLVALLITNIVGAMANVRFEEHLGWPLGISARIAIPFYASAFLFVTRGGTHFVKAVCATGRILPRIMPATKGSNTASDLQNASERQVDQARLGMGRKLGNLERILMLIFVLAGKYEALGFVLAAKGLIRSKEFEDRDFTEYFLLGSLASILIAVLTGGLLQFVTG